MCKIYSFVDVGWPLQKIAAHFLCFPFDYLQAS